MPYETYPYLILFNQLTCSALTKKSVFILKIQALNADK